MPAIIIKNYEHLNKAFPVWDTPQGVHVKSKDHYDRLMKTHNMVSSEESEQQSKKYKPKDYVLSKKAWEIIKVAKNYADKKGKIGNLPTRTIEAMKEIGAINKNIPSYMQLPTAYQNKGSFS